MGKNRQGKGARFKKVVARGRSWGKARRGKRGEESSGHKDPRRAGAILKG